MINSAKAFWLVTGLLWLLWVHAIADQPHGGQPGEFLRYGAGVRPLSMGGAFVGLADDINSIYYNPAGLMSMTGWKATAMYGDYMDASRFAYFALTGPTGLDLRWGGAWINHHMGDFLKIDELDNDQGTFTLDENAIYGTLAWEPICRAWGMVSVGGTLKWVQQGFSSYTGTSGMGADGGILLRWMHIRAGKKPPRPGHINLGRAGLVIQNLLRPTLKTEQYKECLPPQIRMGVSYQWRFQNRSFLLLTEVLPQNGPKFPWVSLDDKSEYSGGCEFQQRMSGGRLAFALRAGFRYPANEITLGAGILFDGESGKGARITDIDASHRVKRVDADGSNWYPEDLLMQVSAGLGPSDSAQYWNAFRADSSAGSETAARRHLLRILERYPELDISKAAERLFCHFDKKHREWYLRVMSDLHDPEFLPPAARPAENSLR